MTLRVAIDPNVVDLAVGLVEASGVRIAQPDSALVSQSQQQARAVRDEGPEGGDERRQAVRQLLRAGGFKPSGRSKPAQEYLLRSASRQGEWPAILNAVDVLNIVSLRSGLPISLISLDRMGTALLIRYGQRGERFVFNQAGQELDVEGLICVCRQQGDDAIPIGSPVKDSQVAKVTAADRHLLGCIFAPRGAVTVATLTQWSSQLGEGLRRWCDAAHIEVRLQPETW